MKIQIQTTGLGLRLLRIALDRMISQEISYWEQTPLGRDMINTAGPLTASLGTTRKIGEEQTVLVTVEAT